MSAIWSDGASQGMPPPGHDPSEGGETTVVQHILVVTASRSLESVIRRIREEGPEWVVLVRTVPWSSDVYHYAYRPEELEALAADRPEWASWPIEEAAELQEEKASATERGGRRIGQPHGQWGPASERIAHFDSAGSIVAITRNLEGFTGSAPPDFELSPPEAAAPVEASPPPSYPERGFGFESSPPEAAPPVAASPAPSDPEEEFVFDLGPMRGGHSNRGEIPRMVGGAAPPPPPSSGAEPPFSAAPMPPFGAAPPTIELESSEEPPPAPPATIEVTLSAETRAEIAINANEVVDFRIELTSEAAPLAVSTSTGQARPDVPITVSISTENDALEVVRSQEYTFAPPSTGQPRTGFFLVKGVRAGLSRLAVTFRQGGSDLGVIGLAIEVVDSAASSAPAKATAIAAPRDRADDDRLALIVEQRNEGGEIFYQYILHSEELGLPYKRMRSKPLLDRGGGPAATTLAFVERVYERVTQELKSVDDLKQLQREARALGATLCQELLDPSVAAELWPIRDRIKQIQIVSWEPYIPWELVRLRDPVSGDIDDRFLAEYGLVRTLSDEMPPRELEMQRWSYLAAAFPMGSLPSVGAEVAYFTENTPDTLRGRGITPEPIAPTRDDLYDALAAGDFDVLHLSCHAESPHKSIERASLIISDETPPGSSTARLVEVDSITVAAEARLRKRRPLIFLNGCETGRLGAVMTEWGGWPNVFLRAGAGAFVGSSWAVRDKPAAAFSTAFYNSLLSGSTLAEAATAAREAGKKLGDASWLAFKVYGHPAARRKIA